MRQPHHWVVSESLAQLAADLLRAPTLLQQLGDDTAEVVVGVDAPVATPSAPGTGATVRLKGPVARPAAAGPVPLSGDSRRRPADPPGDLTDPDAFAVQVGDLDAFLLGEVSGADLTNLEAVQWLDELDRYTASIDGCTRGSS